MFGTCILFFIIMIVSEQLTSVYTRPLFYIYDWPVINETRYGYTSLSNLADVYPPGICLTNYVLKKNLVNIFDIFII